MLSARTQRSWRELTGWYASHKRGIITTGKHPRICRSQISKDRIRNGNHIEGQICVGSVNIMPNTTYYILTLPRRDFKILVGVLTGYCLTTFKEFKLGSNQSAKCVSCDEGKPKCTFELLLCHCTDFGRLSYHGFAFFSSMKEIADQRTGKLLKLYKKRSVTMA